MVKIVESASDIRITRISMADGRNSVGGIILKSDLMNIALVKIIPRPGRFKKAIYVNAPFIRALKK